MLIHCEFGLHFYMSVYTPKTFLLSQGVGKCANVEINKKYFLTNAALHKFNFKFENILRNLF